MKLLLIMSFSIDLMLRKGASWSIRRNICFAFEDDGLLKECQILFCIHIPLLNLYIYLA